MADLDFEDDLRKMILSAPPAPDAEAFARRVERGLDRLTWMRWGLVSALGLMGVLIAWLMFGLSLDDVTGGLNALTSAARSDGVTADDAGGWAAAMLLLALGVLLVRPIFSES